MKNGNGIVLGISFFCVLSLCATNPIANPGFEIGSGKNAVAHWSAPNDTFCYVPGEGRNGTRALSFEVKDDSPYVFPSQTVKLVPGESYIAYAWIRTENIKGMPGGGATIAAEWCRPDGRWYGGRYSMSMAGNVGEFTRVTLPFTYPKDAGRFTISAFITKGCTGKAWFDDLSIVPVKRPFAGPVMVSDAYRNTATSGDVKLSVDVFMPEKDRKAKGVKCLFSLPLASGTRIIESPVTDGFAQTVVDVTELKTGKTRFTFWLKDGGGKVLAERTLDFTRPKAASGCQAQGGMPSWPVRIERNRTIVNGKAFFPLGIFVSRLDDATIARLKKGAFNCAMAYCSPTEKEMDAAHKAGLKVIYSLKDAFYGTRACVSEIKDSEGEIEWVKDRVRRFKSHPALLAWYINDELGIELRDRLVARRNLLEALDPGHPTWVALYQVEDLPFYLGTYDVIGTDPYPICQSGNPPISQVAEHTRLTRRSVFGGMAMWQIPQLFDWGYYRKADVEKTRAPTFEEMRNMQWQYIAEGAMGLVAYAITPLIKMDWRDKFDVQWKKVCDISREMESHIPMFLSEEPSVKVRGAPLGMSVRAWRWEGKDWILCVNATRKRLIAELDIDLYGKVKVDLPPLGLELKSLMPQTK